MDTLKRDVTCKRCKAIMPAGTILANSGGGYRHIGACPPRKPAYAEQIRTTRFPLDSYEAECEAEGIRMRTRGGYPSSY